MTMTNTKIKCERLRYKRYLLDLTAAVEQFVKRLDAQMKLPSTFERGRIIARLTNALEFENDSAKHYGLGLPFRKSKKGEM